MFNRIFVIIFSLILSTQLFFGFTTNAQDIKPTLLAPLPGTTESCSGGVCQTTLQTYLPNLFKLLIGLSAVWAVVMIVIGGFQYMTTDAFSGKEEGKARIWGAVKGLFLVIGAWLILNEINPNLLKINLNLPKVVVEPSIGQGGSVSPGASGLQQETQVALSALRSECTGCTITITSTTGGRHSTNSLHYRGLAVDIAPNEALTRFLTGSTQNPAPCQKFPRMLGGKMVSFIWEPLGARCGEVASDRNHWHMEVIL